MKDKRKAYEEKLDDECNPLDLRRDRQRCLQKEVPAKSPRS